MSRILAKFSGLLVLVSLVSFMSAAGVHAGDAPADSPVQSLEKAVSAAPDDPALTFLLAWARAGAGDTDGALAALQRTLENGEGFLPSAQLFPKLKDDARFAALRERFEAKLPKRVDGEVAFTLSDRELVPEGIAYDAAEHVFYVGGISHKGVYRLVSEAGMRPLSSPRDKVDSILGIAIDSQRRRLYAVSTNGVIDVADKDRRNAIKVYDLTKWALVSSVDVPGARMLNDVAIVPDGTLVVTDSDGGGVWRVDPEGGTATALVALGKAPGANGVAVPPRGGVAYVASNRRPLRVDLRSGEVTPLALPPHENAAAIDGLYWHQGSLIGVQNVTTPARIVRLRLADDGRSITAVETLQSHHQPAFDEPTTAAVAGGSLYVLARTGLSHYNRKGQFEQRETAQPPLILRIRLE
jgi:sugar lactone lactonase YvrE